MHASRRKGEVDAKLRELETAIDRVAASSREDVQDRAIARLRDALAEVQHVRTPARARGPGDEELTCCGGVSMPPPSMPKKIASPTSNKFDESWQEVILLMLALPDAPAFCAPAQAHRRIAANTSPPASLDGRAPAEA